MWQTELPLCFWQRTVWPFFAGLTWTASLRTHPHFFAVSLPWALPRDLSFLHTQPSQCGMATRFTALRGSLISARQGTAEIVRFQNDGCHRLFFFCLQFSEAAEFSCFFFPSGGLWRSFRMNLSANQCQNCGNCNAAERMAGSLPASSATSLYRENAAAACDGALNVVGGEITQFAMHPTTAVSAPS